MLKFDWILKPTYYLDWTLDHITWTGHWTILLGLPFTIPCGSTSNSRAYYLTTICTWIYNLLVVASFWRRCRGVASKVRFSFPIIRYKYSSFLLFFFLFFCVYIYLAICLVLSLYGWLYHLLLVPLFLLVIFPLSFLLFLLYVNLASWS